MASRIGYLICINGTCHHFPCTSSLGYCNNFVRRSSLNWQWTKSTVPFDPSLKKHSHKSLFANQNSTIIFALASLSQLLLFSVRLPMWKPLDQAGSKIENGHRVGDCQLRHVKLRASVSQITRQFSFVRSARQCKRWKSAVRRIGIAANLWPAASLKRPRGVV